MLYNRPMPAYNLEGIVIKSSVYKDTGKIYTLFTKEKGKISAFANGVRKISSRRAGNLDTLNHISLGVTESAAGHKTITEVKTINSFITIKNSLEFSAHVYYVLELIQRFFEEDEQNTPVFNLMLSTLTRLSKAKNGLEFNVVINAFEIKLMGILGYEMQLDRCAYCGRDLLTEAWDQYKFNMSLGGLCCHMCNKPGVLITSGTAHALHSLWETKKVSSNAKDLSLANEVIKFFVKQMLEDNIRTYRVYRNI